MTISPQSYANLPFWGWLPMAATTVGGNVHVVRIPDYLLPNQQIFQLNDVARSTLNRSYNDYDSSNRYPVVSCDEFEQQVEERMIPYYNKAASGSINTSLNNINMCRTKLDSLLLKDGITEAQKTEIENHKKALEEQEKQLQQLMEQEQITPKAAYYQALEIQKRVNEIARQICNIKINGSEDNTSTENTNGNDNAGTENANGTDGTNGAP